MDREALVRRNRSMTEAFHATPLRHHIRRGLLRMLASIPVSDNRIPERERILLIRPDHLGDMLLTTPAIHALRRAVPDADLHALVGPWSAEVTANYPEIDAVLTLPFPGFSRSPNPSLRFPYQLALQASRHLRQIGYSSAVIFRPDHWWGAMLAALAGIPRRIGYDLSDVAPFLTHPITFEHKHAVEQNLRLVEGWTGSTTPHRAMYRFNVDDELDRAYVDGYLQEWGIAPQRPVICIHPGSGTWVKRWDPAAWATVADTLTEQIEASIVLTGGDHEMPIARAIAEQMQHEPAIIVGETDVFQLAALFQRARLVMGSDSGPLHLAVATSTPTVTLFGPADPVEFGPWGPRDKHAVVTSEIGCRPCRILDWTGDDPENHPCVRDITIGQVLNAAHQVMQHSDQG